MRRVDLISIGAALLLGNAAQAQQMADFAPSFNACAHTHKDEALYFATMRSDGWTVVEDRETALLRISDSFLPVLGPSALPWDETLLARAGNGTRAAAELIGDRDIYTQDDHLLVIGGYTNEEGAFRLDCWMALPDDSLNDVVFSSSEDQAAQPEMRMAAFGGPEHADGSVTRIMAVQLIPDTPPDPPLAGRNGLYIQTIVPDDQTPDDGQNLSEDN
jgi:hypothetical protein